MSRTFPQPELTLTDAVSVHNTLLRLGDFRVYERWLSGQCPEVLTAIKLYEQEQRLVALGQAVDEGAKVRRCEEQRGRAPMHAIGYGRNQAV